MLCGVREPWVAEAFNSIPWVMTGVLAWICLYFVARGMMAKAWGAGFKPSHAKQILIALDEAAKEGRGAAQLNGRMIDAASAKMAENIVNTDKAIQAKLKG